MHQICVFCRNEIELLIKNLNFNSLIRFNKFRILKKNKIFSKLNTIIRKNNFIFEAEKLKFHKFFI